MSKVKYDPKMEYEYLDNFKILQKSFKQHGVDKVCTSSSSPSMSIQQFQRDQTRGADIGVAYTG